MLMLSLLSDGKRLMLGFDQPGEGTRPATRTENNDS